MARWNLVLGYLKAGFLLLACFVGLLAFILVPLSLGLIQYYGGSAMNGYRKGDAYFLVAHGKSYEVTGTVYHRMLFIEKAAIICVLIAGVTALFILVARKLKRI